MSANDNTLIQLNWKTDKGSLINGYARSEEELQLIIDVIARNKEGILSIEDDLKGGTYNAPPANVGEAINNLSNAGIKVTPIATVGAPASNGAPMCEHGQPCKLVPAGISSKTGNPYKAFYACAYPQAQACKFKKTA